MWMVDPQYLCKQHLLGEHVECHMFAGTLKKKIKIDGYIKNNLLEPAALINRHAQLVAEMEKRGMRHGSPLEEVSISYLPKAQQEFTVNRERALIDLHKRCSKCIDRGFGLEEQS